MRLVVVVLALFGCQKQKHVEAEHDVAAASPSASVLAVVSASASAQPALPSATASASASVPMPARIPCGTKTCGPTQFCVHESKGRGIAPPPGHDYVTSTSYECWSSVPAHGGGWSCGPVGKNREVSCVAMIPATRPRGP